MAMKKQSRSATAKSSVRRRRRLVEGSQQVSSGIPGSEQDPRRRLRNFQAAGEHARKGGRTSGIVGQTAKHHLKTDNRKPKA